MAVVLAAALLLVVLGGSDDTTPARSAPACSALSEQPTTCLDNTVVGHC